MTDDELSAVAREHAPVLVFHPEERYLPLDPEVFIEGAELRWRGDDRRDRHLGGGVRGSIEPAQLGPESELRSPCRQSFRPADFTRPYDPRKRKIESFPGFRASPLDSGFYLHYIGDRDRLKVERDMSATHVAATSKCFFEVDDEGSPTRITYWYFFAASTLLDKPLERALVQEVAGKSERDAADIEPELLGRFVELHEGDWEGVTVQLGGENAMLLHQHGALVRVPRAGREEPCVYVARGSHAAVAGGPDTHGEAVGDGTRWDLRKARVENARRQPWYGYGGAWGAVNRDIPNIPDAIADALIKTQGRDPRADRTGPLGPSLFKAVLELGYQSPPKSAPIS